MSSGFYAIIAFLVGFSVAQMGKVVILLMKRKAENKSGKVNIIDELGKSGGMPSGHSASLVALSVYVGLETGFTSLYFAICFAVSVIVIYDAVNVRQAVGRQGILLAKMTTRKERERRILGRIVEGHTFFQAFVGILIGIIIGVMTFLISK